MENEAIINDTTTAEAPKAPAAETPAGRVSVGDSVRAALDKAATTPKAEVKADDKPTTPSADKSRAPDGKFAKKDVPDPIQAVEPEVSPEKAEVEPPRQAVKPPQSLKGELKEKFSELPPEWQGEIDRLERVAVKKIQETSQMANFGKSLADEFAPYQDLMKQAGATPQQALKSFLNTEYVLRTAPQAQKLATFVNLARHYGIDLTGIQQGQTPQIDPQVSAIHEENLRLRREQAQRSNAETTQVNSAIEQFAADPKNEHFETVRQHMGALIENGTAASLGDAYEQACWANPTIRNQLIQSREQEAEAKRKADERKAVELKKSAAVSIRGTPASPIAPVQGKESVRQTIARVALQSQGRI